MAGWHYWLDGRESEWIPRVGDGQGGLACCDSWGQKESDMTERLNWTELKEKWTIKPLKYMEETNAYCSTKWNKIWRGYIQCHSNYMTFWKRQNNGDSKTTSGYQGLGRRVGWTGGIKMMFRVVKLFCMTLSWWIHVILHLFKSMEHVAPSDS